MLRSIIQNIPLTRFSGSLLFSSGFATSNCDIISKKPIKNNNQISNKRLKLFFSLAKHAGKVFDKMPQPIHRRNVPDLLLLLHRVREGEGRLKRE